MPFAVITFLLSVRIFLSVFLVKASCRNTGFHDFPITAYIQTLNIKNGGCEITASTEKEDFSFKMNERSSFMLKLTCDENFNYKL